MPISAGLSALQSQISAEQNAGIAGNPSLTSVQIASALASVAPMGVMMIGPTPTPVVPAGFAACQSVLQAAFNAGIAGTPTLSSTQIASAISLLAPMVPPIGISLLQTLIQNISNMGIAGSSDSTAQLLATAIITYFTIGLVL